ncbi:MBL fold metallo-hydrolase [Deltaproteobacteria bacterium]|nr:MBL fold metallo-hydrolase [Deltaproteobacteria bacterium]
MSASKEVKMLISFWGTRGSVSTPGRITEKYGGNTPCVSVRCQDTQIIFDAGTGIRNLGIELLEEIKREDNPPSLHLFLSHTHWDHIQGLPFFMPSYHKDTKLTIYGSPRKERFLASILKEQMDYEYFPVSMSAFPADISIQEIGEENIRLGALTVEWQEQIFHPGGSVRYKVSLNGKKVVYATDVELDNMFNNIKHNEENRALAQEFMSFISHADLLIADAQYTEDEYRDKVGWGHSSIPVLLDTAFQSQVKQLAIFHHDPQHSDKLLDELWMKNRSKYHAGDRKMDLFWAREGMTLAV